MSAPLNREQQIELMRDADKRIPARVQAWLRDRTVRRVLSKPAPGQDTETIHTQKQVRIACG